MNLFLCSCIRCCLKASCTTSKQTTKVTVIIVKSSYLEGNTVFSFISQHNSWETSPEVRNRSTSSLIKKTNVQFLFKKRSKLNFFCTVGAQSFFSYCSHLDEVLRCNLTPSFSVASSTLGQHRASREFKKRFCRQRSCQNVSPQYKTASTGNMSLPR